MLAHTDGKVVPLLFASLVAATACSRPSPTQPLAPTVSEGQAGPRASTVPKALTVQPPPSASAKATTRPNAPIPIESDDPVLGSRDALVSIVVFSDLECPYCRDFDDALRRLYARRPAGEVRVVWKNRPLPNHALAGEGALLGRAVYESSGSAAFFRFTDQVFRSQLSLSRAKLVELAKAEGKLSREALWDGLRAGRWLEKIKRDLLLAEEVGAHSTPVSFWNGARVPGHLDDADFRDLYDRVLKHARELEKSGVARTELYETACRTLYEAP